MLRQRERRRRKLSGLGSFFFMTLDQANASNFAGLNIDNIPDNAITADTGTEVPGSRLASHYPEAA